MQTYPSPIDRLHHHYHILKEIGHGSCSRVFLAEDRQTGQPVAIKRLRQSDIAPKLRGFARLSFQREAQVLEHLRHPQIPLLHTYDLEDFPWFLAMDFIEGETLEQWFHHLPNGILPINVAAGIAWKMCQVVSYLHHFSPSIKFRDLTPANIMLARTGEIYLIDFGCACPDTGAPDEDAAGTPGYAAPEQYPSKQRQSAATIRSDVYSLGVILHQMLSGEDPRFALVKFAFSSLSGRAPHTLVTLIEHMLAYQPNARPTIDQVSIYLAPFAQG